ncbi:endo alpha-1,4 polygalactosaminidase [Agreia pratensis]|uniref:endo alpha-1,4 polygalactosaminidase n=1 Tax=Agreia pratensis TaxID=150121 RepID=UPI00188AA90B|nr:endo alpha-1,4 polygalactosaminidase [Agreia pratensis]MBF4633561.1 endo alpha-1,4 polygalactosaminidase [Agreia pratensis]
MQARISTALGTGAAAVAILGLLAACTADAREDDQASPTPTGSTYLVVTSDSVTLPPFGEAADYQLGGSYDVDDAVKIVARDSTSTPAEGVYSICYVNGFQSQPGDDERWSVDNPGLVLRDDDGQAIIDPNWPDEFILDTSSPEKRQRISRMIGASIETCADKGFDAVEIDNLDTYSRSDGRLSIDDNLALAKLFADRAHGHAMAIGQKNSAELGELGRTRAGFDFAVTEECVRFEECGAYAEVYDDRVIDIEYTDDLSAPFDEICASAGRPATTILRDRNLVAKGEADYVFEHC